MDAMSNHSIFDPIEFRKALHRKPELSEQEELTSKQIFTQLQNFGLCPIGQIGGFGIICVIDSGREGDITLLRADFDALPICETSQHDHVSENSGVMHACGHDGHTASLMSVAEHLSRRPPLSGKVVLLFQPAEEIGTGAIAMLKDERLGSLQVDNVFAYHNLPGYPVNHILIKDGTFACASTGVLIELEGKTSHAARPENGLSPTQAMVDTIEYLQNMPNQHPNAFSLVTIVHATLGEQAFGVSPGSAKIMATMRSDCNNTFEEMKANLQNQLASIELRTGIKTSLTWDEPFRASINSSKHSQLVEQRARNAGLSVTIMEEPIRWSEDFAEFLSKWNGALFCIGSGESHPELHNPDYDFPDEIICTASQMFISLINELHNKT